VTTYQDRKVKPKVRAMKQNIHSNALNLYPLLNSLSLQI